MYVFYHYTLVRQNCNVIRALSPFLGRLFEGSGNMYTYKSYPLFLNFSGSLMKNIPYLGRFVEKHPVFRVFSGKSSRDKRPKNTPFPERPPCTLEGGGGTGQARRKMQTDNETGVATIQQTMATQPGGHFIKCFVSVFY